MTRSVFLLDQDYNLVSFAPLLNVQFVQFKTPNNAYGASGTDNGYGFITELQLFQVPEPTTAALLAIGGLMVWRRRQAGLA